MGTVLFVTVGWSEGPIIKSIKSFKPDFIYFVVTDDSDNNEGTIKTVKGEYYVRNNQKYESIPKRLSLSETQYKIIIVDPDDPFDVYNNVIPFIEDHLRKQDEVLIDSTGGTKSMSIGLAFAQGEYPETKFSLVVGPRLNSVKVIDGMERVKRFSQNEVYKERQIKNSQSFIAKREYNAAYEVLDKLSTEAEIDNEQFERLYLLSQGFDAWDKFRYEDAAIYIERYKNDKRIKPYNAILKQLISIKKLIDTWTPETRIPTNNGFILVYDLMYNAERKAEANYFDDAVARVYRALEMYEQFALFTNDPPLDTSNLDMNKLPENIRERYTNENEKDNKIGLKRGYELLEDLNHPVGQVWSKYKHKLLDKLKIRNLSYFAHGFEPTTKDLYEEMRDVAWNFIYECDQAMGFRETIKDYPQLPKEF